MIKILNSAEVPRKELFYRGSSLPDEQIVTTVRSIIDDVRQRGDAAVKEYALRFDKVELKELRVSPEEFQEANESAGPELIKALTGAAENIRANS